MTSDLLITWLVLVVVLWLLVSLLDRAILRLKQRRWESRHDHFLTERADYDPDFNWPARQTIEEER